MPAGRPTKLTSNVIEALKSVLDDVGILVLTDEDLLFLVNERLKPAQQISKASFEEWKSGKFPKTTHVANEFSGLIKKALLQERKNLLKELREAKSGEWQKYAWIIERKFDEWNIKNKQEFSSSVEQPLKIVIGDDPNGNGESDPIE